MDVTIDRRQRDAIYEEVLTDLSGIGDVWIAISQGDYEKALEYRRRFEHDMRLLDEIGWDREQERESFRLSMPGELLAEAVRHLNENARANLHHHIVEPWEERMVAERSVIASAAYSDVLAQLAGGGVHSAPGV